MSGSVAPDRVRRWLEDVASGDGAWDPEAAAELAVALPAPRPDPAVLAPPALPPFAVLRDALADQDAPRARTSARWLLHLLAPEDPAFRPTLSVVIPVYGAPELARRAVESALAQSWPPTEVVVVDDGSEPPLELGELAADPAVRLVRQANAGASAARNRGIAEARGDWVHFLDADDALFPHALETQWAALRSAPGAEMCVSRYRSEGADPGSRGAHGPGFGDEACPTQDLLATWVRRYPFQTSTVLLPRWLLAEVGPFEEEFPQGEDARYWFRLALRGTRVAAVDAPLVARRFRPGSLSASESAYGPILFTMALIALLEDPARWPYVDALAERMQGRRRWEWLDEHEDPWLERLRGELLAVAAGLPSAARAVAGQLRARIAGRGDAFLARLDAALATVQEGRGRRGARSSRVGSLDVVVVPDFAGPARALFEARTRLFLGSWIEHRGASRHWPLHLVAIGELPPAVAALAERAGARVHAAATLDAQQPYLNKLRGLEIEASTDHILLLDADTVVLGDLSPALELGSAFAALPAATNRIPNDVWAEVFAAGGTAPPAERMRPLIGEWERDLPDSVMRPPFREEVPLHWNSGVIHAPAGCGLRQAWEEAARALAAHFEKSEWYGHVCGNDQPSLAVAAARVRAKGVPYQPLPFALHGFDLLYATGKLRFDQTAVYHAKTLFRRDKEASRLDPLHELALYRAHQLPRLYPESTLQRALRRLSGRAQPRRADSIVAFCDRIEELTRRYVV